jgi:hypothetical protein
MSSAVSAATGGGFGRPLRQRVVRMAPTRLPKITLFSAPADTGRSGGRPRTRWATHPCSC